MQPNGRRFRVRVRVQGKRVDLGSFGSEAEAEQIRRGFLAAQASGAIPTGELTVSGWGARWLDARELAGNRAIVSDRNRWKNHVDGSDLADIPLRALERSDVKQWLRWLRPRVAGWQTRRHCLNLLRRALADAVDDEVIERNVAVGLSVPKEVSGGERWTYLTPDEQRRLATCELGGDDAEQRLEGRAEVLIALVALGTGMRQGEQWSLELSDVHVDDAEPWLYLRWGSKDQPPKNGRPRRIELFGIGLEAMRSWLEALPLYAKRNPEKLVFPTRRGYRRGLSKQPRHWKEILRAARLDDARTRHDRRTVRWHDLRHTCASSLVAGWWGKRWSIQAVRDLLGHGSVTVTERYAHLAPGVLTDMASETRGPNLALEVQRSEAKSAVIPGARHAGFEPATFGFGGPGRSPELLATCDQLRARVRAKRDQYVRAIAGRNRFAHRYGLELVELVSEMLDALDALGGGDALSGQPLRVVRGGAA